MAEKHIISGSVIDDAHPLAVEQGALQSGTDSVDAESPVTAITLYAVTCTLANTEYSQALPATCRRVCFKCRSSVDVRYAWATGKVATPTDPYRTLAAGWEYDSGAVKLTGFTVYLASATAGAVVEVEAYS